MSSLPEFGFSNQALQMLCEFQEAELKRMEGEIEKLKEMRNDTFRKAIKLQSQYEIGMEIIKELRKHIPQDVGIAAMEAAFATVKANRACRSDCPVEDPTASEPAAPPASSS